MVAKVRTNAIERCSELYHNVLAGMKLAEINRRYKNNDTRVSVNFYEVDNTVPR